MYFNAGVVSKMSYSANLQGPVLHNHKRLFSFGINPDIDYRKGSREPSLHKTIPRVGNLGTYGILPYLFSK